MKSILFAILLAGLCSGSQAQAPAGSPYMQHYQLQGPGNEGGVSSMWQDSLGIMYFTTRTGVFKYDGCNWNFFQLPEHITIVKQAPNNRWFAGATRGGYLLTPRPDGSTWAQRLDARQRVMKNTSDITFVDNSVCFYSASAIYLYDAANMKLFAVLVEPSSGFRGFFHHMNNFYVLVKNKGLATLRDNRLKPLKNSIIKGEIRGSIPVSATKSLFITKQGNIFSMSNDTVEMLNTRLFSDICSPGEITSVVNLNDSLFSVATSQAGIFIMKKAQLEVAHHLCIATGLPSDKITSQYRDKKGGLWVSTPPGVTRVDFSLPISNYGSLAGITGEITGFQIYRNHVYVTTSTGIFVYKNSDERSHHGHQHYRYTQTTVKALMPGNQNKSNVLTTVKMKEEHTVDANFTYSFSESRPFSRFENIEILNGNDSKLVATMLGLYAVTNKGVFELKGDTVSVVLPGDSCIDVTATTRHLVVLTPRKLVLVQVGKTIKVLDSLDVGVDRPLTDVCFGAGFVWVSCGNMLLKIPELTSNIFGFAKEIYSVYNEKIKVVGNKQNVYFFSGNKQLFHDRISDSLKLSKRFDNIIMGNNRYFALTISAKAIKPVGDVVLQQGKARLLNLFDPKIIDILPGGNIATLDKDGIFIIHDSASPTNTTPFVSSATTINGLFLPTDDVSIVHKTDGLILKLACPNFIAEDKTMFRFRLNGVSNSWSPWSSTTELTFQFLPAGSYDIEIEACTATGDIFCIPRTIIHVRHSWEDYSLHIIIPAGTCIVALLVFMFFYSRKKRRH